VANPIAQNPPIENEFQFSDCTNAQLSFDFNASDNNDGSVAIIRLSPDVFCQAIIDAAQAMK